MELLQLGFCSLGSRCNRPGRGGRRKRRGSGSGRKKLTGFHPGLTGWTGSRVDPSGRLGFPGSIPKRVFASTRTGPRPGSAGSRAGPVSGRPAGPVRVLKHCLNVPVSSKIHQGFRYVSCIGHALDSVTLTTWAGV
jgi:hypothetical protein